MNDIKEYVHTVQYYETDKMGITHHSNYIRWMEEARVDFLDQIGWSYAKLESTGVASAVVNITCDYKHPTRFSDKVSIRVSVKELNGVTLKFAYTMKDINGSEVCAGTSLHAFLNAEGKLIALKRACPELFAVFEGLCGK